MIWQLKKPLYGFNDASRKFWLKVKEVFEETDMLRLQGDDVLYFRHNKEGDLEGMISSHVDDFKLTWKDIFFKRD